MEYLLESAKHPEVEGEGEGEERTITVTTSDTRISQVLLAVILCRNESHQLLTSVQLKGNLNCQLLDV